VGDCLRLVPDGRKLDLFEIDLWGGFAHIRTDLDLADVMPLAFTRSVVPLDAWAKRHKIYILHVYDPFMFGDRFPYTFEDWTLPDRKSIHFERISPGTSFADAVYEAKSARNEIFAGSQIKWNGWVWDLSLENGTTFLSPEAYNATRPQQGSLVGIFDKERHEVRLSRKSSGDLTKIESPSGRWIKFTYDEGRMIEARDSLRNVVEYKYDAEGRLVRASILEVQRSSIRTIPQIALYGSKTPRPVRCWKTSTARRGLSNKPPSMEKFIASATWLTR